MATVPEFRSRTGPEATPLAVLTAYDAVTAGLVEAAGADAILVGDSMGTTVLGRDSTLPVTVDQVADRTAAVVRGTEDTLVIADLPFLSVGADPDETVETAGRMLKGPGADAVKIESGAHTVALTERLVDLGVPVMAHVGLAPQRIRQLGGYVEQGRTAADADAIRDLAVDHADAGRVGVAVEHVPEDVAADVTAAIDAPTIGIGAGPETDGQVLVFHDAVGLSESPPPFAEAFGDARAEIEGAASGFVDAVRSGAFPADE
jgi:3-methyl-2-oxobutanoate hydroxymethyltransferase